MEAVNNNFLFTHEEQLRLLPTFLNLITDAKTVTVLALMPLIKGFEEAAWLVPHVHALGWTKVISSNHALSVPLTAVTAAQCQ